MKYVEKWNKGALCEVLNKDKIIKAEIFDSQGRTIISTKALEFPRDFFNVKTSEFVVFKGSNILPINKGEKVDAVFYYLNGMRVKYITTIDLATDMQVNIHIGQEYTVLEERRRYYKTETNLIGTVSLYTREEENVIVDPPINIRIKNINIGGIFMMSPFEFQIGDIYVLNILDCKLTLSTEILRIQRDNEGKITGYGCRFINTSRPQEEIITRFIFECQRVEREKRKRMGM